MIVDRIYEYLNSEGKTFDEMLLHEALGKLRSVLQRQLMFDREEKPGSLYVTRFSHPCARKGAYGYHGFESEDFQPRAKLNFLIGDVVELAVYTAAKLAGCDVGLSQARILLDVDGYQASGYIDGIVGDHVLEIKKMNSWGFRRFRKDGVDDTWGYMSQVQAYIKGMKLEKALVVALNAETGALHEQVILFDERIWLAARNRALAIVESAPERLPMRAIPTLRTRNQREKLGLQCSYCNYRKHCWPDAVMELVKRKPVWYVGKGAE